jgi:hypothetical protein
MSLTFATDNCFGREAVAGAGSPERLLVSLADAVLRPGCLLQDTMNPIKKVIQCLSEAAVLLRRQGEMPVCRSCAAVAECMHSKMCCNRVK